MPSKMRYLVAVDMETTCHAYAKDFPPEVIQLGAAVIDTNTLRILENKKFSMFVRPVLVPELTTYCREFTGIRQRDVDSAEDFGSVLRQFDNFLQSLGCAAFELAIVSDSRQDSWRIAQYNCLVHKMPLPSYFRQYVNIYRIFTNHLAQIEHPEFVATTNIGKMSEFYQLEQYGIAHNAYNDARNLANITLRMLEDLNIDINEVLVCFARWRQHEITELAIPWKLDFQSTMKVYERILPLVPKHIHANSWNANRYGLCQTCRKTNDKCGIEHRQFPHILYKKYKESIVFADKAEWFLI